MSNPSIAIDLKKITNNTKVIAEACLDHGIETVGVVKACMGNRAVAEAMIAGGASVIADSRLANFKELESLPVPLMMLRQPMISEISHAISIVDIFLVSEIKTLKSISSVASTLGLKPSIIVMVELGDLREGIMIGDLDVFVGAAKELPNINVIGIGANVACLQGVLPTPDMLEELSSAAERIRNQLGIEIPVVSGGNSSAWKLVKSGMLPKGVNQLRFGEGILLGQETIDHDPIDGSCQDAVVLRAEIIEIKDKPAWDKERHESISMKRAILALGTQDVCCGELKPMDRSAVILKKSSDHTVVDVGSSKKHYDVGDCMSFIPSYEAMLAAMTSPFVKKDVL